MTEAQKLTETVKELFTNNKGLLAIDESTVSCNKRFAKLGIPETEESRRAWRELIITTPNLSDAISGFILYDQTIRQVKADGTPFVKVMTGAGIIPGIKVDGGLKDMEGHSGEKVTEGLEGLSDRLKEYVQMGARFAKWRAAFSVSDILPSSDCIETNAKILAEYAFACQEAGIVPIVEPEVLMDGSHTMERCRQVTERVLKTVFAELKVKGVALKNMILKPNMVVPGLECPTQESVDQVADTTIKLFMEVVPANVGGVAFLSGGQSGKLAAARLNAMHVNFKGKLPWPLTFSFSRAIQYPALEIWQGIEENIAAAQQALLHRAKCNQAALCGEYKAEYDVWPGQPQNGF